MSGENRRAPAPQDPLWSPDLLAHLHADALDPETTARTRDIAANDPRTDEVLAALDNTTRELNVLGTEHATDTIPDHIAERLDVALTHELCATGNNAPTPQAKTHSGTPADAIPDHDPAGPTRQPSKRPRANVVDLAARRRRGILLSAGTIAAAASIAAIVFTFQPLGSHTTEQAQTTPPTPTPPINQDRGHQPPANSAPIALQGDEADLNNAQFAQVMGEQQYVGLDDPNQLPGCLQANGVAHNNPLGAHNITLNGDPAQLFVLSTGQLGQFRLLAVGPDCGPDNPATISDSTYGGT